MAPGAENCPYCEGAVRIDCLPAADGSVVRIAVCRCGWCKACAEVPSEQRALKQSGVRIKAQAVVEGAAYDPSEAAE